MRGSATLDLTRLLVLLAVIASLPGCTIGRKWFQIDSNSRTPGFGLELRAENSTSTQETPEPEADTPVIEPAEYQVEPTGKRFRDWFRLGRREKTVPLSPTDETVLDRPNVAVPFQGPDEEFD